MKRKKPNNRKHVGPMIPPCVLYHKYEEPAVARYQVNNPNILVENPKRRSKQLDHLFHDEISNDSEKKVNCAQNV